MPGIPEGPLDPLHSVNDLDSIWELTPDANKREASSLLEFLGTHFEALSDVEHKTQLLHIRQLAKKDLKGEGHQDVFEFLEELFQTSRENELSDLSQRLKDTLQMAEQALTFGDMEKGKLAELLKQWQTNSLLLAQRLQVIEEGLQYLTEGQVKGFLEELRRMIGDLKKESARLSEEWQKLFESLCEALEQFQEAIRGMLHSQKPVSKGTLKKLGKIQEKASKQFSGFVSRHNERRREAIKMTTGLYQKLHKKCLSLSIQQETHLDFFTKLKKELIRSQKDDWHLLIEPCQQGCHQILQSIMGIYSLLQTIVERPDIVKGDKE